jgi:hypothetical protein
LKKAKKLRKQMEALEPTLSELGTVTAQLSFTKKKGGEGIYIGKLSRAAQDQFLELWAPLHELYLAFGAK